MVWSFSGLSILKRSSSTAVTYLPPAKKRCNAMESKGAQVAERLIRRHGGRQANPRGCPQGLCCVKLDTQLLCQELGVQPHVGICLNLTLVRHLHRDLPPPAQAGSREGFISEMLFTNSKSGREALKCALPLNTLQHKSINLMIICFRLASNLVHPFTLATSSRMGVGSASPANPHTNQR